jgi:four helix bundle protein
LLVAGEKMNKIYNRGYEDLQVWQQAIDLAVNVYNLTRLFPADEKFGLTSQMRRAGYSIGSNIAEGCSRDGTNEFLHFLSIAKGSLAELKTQAVIANRIELLKQEQFDAIVVQINLVGRMLNGLQNSLRADKVLSNQQLVTSN